MYGPDLYGCAGEHGPTQDPLFSAEQTTTNLTVLDNNEESICKDYLNILGNDDPYPDKTPSSILTREYRLLDVLITTNAAITVHPLDSLRNVPTIKDYLSRFRWLRSKIRVRVQITASPSTYGALLVGVLPYNRPTEGGWNTHLEQVSQQSAALLDLSTQNSVTYELPHLTPYNYYSTTPANEPQWRVVMKPLFLQTLDIQITAQYNVQLYASFVDPETAGYMPATFQSMVEHRSPLMSRLAAMIPNAPATMGVLATVGAAGVGNIISNTVSLFKSATTAYETVKKVQPLVMSKEPSIAPTQIKMTIGSDLSPPGVVNTSDRVNLGDGFPTVGELPELNTDKTLNAICSRNTIVALNSFSSANQHVDFAVTPTTYNTYSKYLARMFKFWRGGQLMTFTFITSPLVAAKFQITLFPNSVTSSDPHIVGDLPTWVVAVNGTTTVTIPVPFLSHTAWKLVNDVDVYHPNIRVQLVEEVVSGISTAMVFLATSYATDYDFQFAGLESEVPGNTAVFQSFVDDLPTRKSCPMTFDHPYQGGVMNVDDVLSRFSSRKGATQYIYPFPLKINNWTQAFDLDNFDYLSNLFCFFYGDVQVKTLYTGNVSPTLLMTQVRNSKETPTGIDYKSSNGIVVTEQTVWPVLEYVFPYLSQVPYDSVHNPIGMYGQKTNAPANIETYFVARAQNFSLSYLYPLPDFFFTALPLVESEGETPAVFQSASVTEIFEAAISFPFTSFVPNITFTDEYDSMFVTLDIDHSDLSTPALLVFTDPTTYPGSYSDVISSASQVLIYPFRVIENGPTHVEFVVPRVTLGSYVARVYFFNNPGLYSTVLTVSKFRNPDLIPRWSTPYKP